MEPLVPYLSLRELPLLAPGAVGWGLPPGAVTLKPFGTAVALGAYVGAWLALRQGRRLGLDPRKLASLLLWSMVGGFVGAHVFELVLYEPARVLRDPISLLRVWDGLSSFGGFAGTLIGGLVWRWQTREALLPYADVIASAFPVSWCFGRLGCSFAHDHPGISSSLWFAVRYPEGGRLDLGLLELALTLPIALTFLMLRRRPRPWGFYAGTLCIAYAPSRFALDFLRILPGDLAVADARYGGLTPAQWGALALLGLGVWSYSRAMDGAGLSPGLHPPERSGYRSTPAA